MDASWPTTCSCRTSSIFTSRSVSVAASLVTGIPVHMLTTSAISSSPTLGVSSPLSECQLVSTSSSFSERFISRSRSSAAYSYCRPDMASFFSLRTLSSIFIDSFTDSGAVEKLMRTLEAASSIRSMALSGKNLSAIKRDDMLAAAAMASSVITSWWCSSYRVLMPWRISTVSSTDGSSTRTGWKRLSKAGSLSTYLR